MDNGKISYPNYLNPKYLLGYILQRIVLISTTMEKDMKYLELSSS